MLKILISSVTDSLKFFKTTFCFGQIKPIRIHSRPYIHPQWLPHFVISNFFFISFMFWSTFPIFIRNTWNTWKHLKYVKFLFFISFPTFTWNQQALNYLINLTPNIQQTTRTRINRMPTFHCHTDCFKNTFCPFTLKDWYKLDKTIRNSKSISILKSRLLSLIRPLESNVIYLIL